MMADISTALSLTRVDDSDLMDANDDIIVSAHLDNPEEDISTESTEHRRGSKSESSEPPRNEVEIVEVPPVVRIGPSKNKGNFVATQAWEGYVQEIHEKTIRVRLVDKAGKTPDEEAEIFIGKVPQADRDLIEPGAVFYWTIGVLDTPDGDRLDQSSIRFRRLPRWVESDIKSARTRANDLAKDLGWPIERDNAERSSS